MTFAQPQSQSRPAAYAGRSLTFRLAERTLRLLSEYHDYRAHGLENVPREGGALVAFHHSLATYDSFLLGGPLADELDRELCGTADRTIFRTPLLGHIFTEMGFRDGTREGTLNVLRNGELLGVAPGGMRDGLRASSEKYRFDWSNRRGFVWVAMTAGVPIILAACPQADDIFEVYGNPVTPALYRRFKFPLPIFRGRWITLVPRPVRLWHLIAEPMVSDVAPDQVTERDVLAMHARVVTRMDRLMKDAMDLRR